MPSCARVRSNLTAWIDGELTPRLDERVQLHLARCPACSAEAGSLRAAIARQGQVLARLTGAERVDARPLWAALHQAIAREERIPSRRWLPRWDADAPRWGWLLRPVTVVSATAAAVVLVFVVFGGTQRVLVPLGVAPPPPAVARSPELFKDYSLIQHLDALENFDTVNAEPLDDEQTSEQG